ncbi:hypothetical protein PTKIN_Ptkin04bG0103800 [Pterospermum kingtungense]
MNNDATDEHRWMPLVDDQVKLNVDASFNMHAKTAIGEIVARDKEEVVLLSATYKFLNTKSVLYAELQAILAGIGFARETGFTRVDIESDSLLAVAEIKKRRASCSEWRCIVQDIMDLLASFHSCDISHVRLICNYLADAITRISYLVGDHTVWMNSLPLDVCNIDVIAS